MKANYNEWFYDQHQYTKHADGKYTDVKWIDELAKYKKLIEQSSALPEYENYNVIGNTYGLDKYFELMIKSGFEFEDIDIALKNTYNFVQRNAMSRNLVDTQALICAKKSNELSRDTLESDMYIIDIPYMQMHFGHRDEFIRNKLKNMNLISQNGKNNFMPINEFCSNEICRILGFTLLCTADGKISNNCYVGINEYGFRFKIRWTSLESTEFIIYKLENSAYIEFEYNINSISDVIKADEIRECSTKYNLNGARCILNFYSAKINNINSVPNFGTIYDNTIHIPYLQSESLEELRSVYSNTTCTVRVHVLTNIFEMKEVYNTKNDFLYLDQFDVYDEKGESIVDGSHNKIVGSSDIDKMKHEYSKSLPPIILDRYETNITNDIIKLYNVTRDLTNEMSVCIDYVGSVVDSAIRDKYVYNRFKYEIDESPAIHDTKGLSKLISTYEQICMNIVVLTAHNITFNADSISKARYGINAYNGLYDLVSNSRSSTYTSWIKSEKPKDNATYYPDSARMKATVTSLCDKSYEEYKMFFIDDFELSVSKEDMPTSIKYDKEGTFNFDETVKISDYSNYKTNSSYVDNGSPVVDVVNYRESTSILYHNKATFSIELIEKIYYNKRSNIFNRPIAEQSLIALKQSNNKYKTYLFANPEIHHFEGIENVFYFDKDSVDISDTYRIFVLYTKTEAPAETQVPDFKESVVLDFDKFYEELDRHTGFIRYWNAENKLAKYALTYYGKYNSQSVVQSIRDISAGIIKDNAIINDLPSLLNYELSNASTLNFDSNNYDAANLMKAPFIINFMLYSILLMRDNKDLFESHFYRFLFDRKFENRYTDYTFDYLTKDKPKFLVNTSCDLGNMGYLTISPAKGTIPELYYGAPNVYNSNNMYNTIMKEYITCYKNTINCYPKGERYYKVNNDGSLDYNKYLENTSDNYSYREKYRKYTWVDTLNALNQFMAYVHEIKSIVETNYVSSWNQRESLVTAKDSINLILDFYKSYGSMVAGVILPSIRYKYIEYSVNEPLKIIDEVIKCIDDILNVTWVSDGVTYTKDLYTLVYEVIKRIDYCNTYIGFFNYDPTAVSDIYNHFKQLYESELNLYALRNWRYRYDNNTGLANVDNLILSSLKYLDSYLTLPTELKSDYEYLNMTFNTFIEYYNVLSTHLTKKKFDALETAYNKFDSEALNTYLKKLKNYVYLCERYMVPDLFGLSSVDINFDYEYDTRPNIITIRMIDKAIQADVRTKNWTKYTRTRDATFTDMYLDEYWGYELEYDADLCACTEEEYNEYLEFAKTIWYSHWSTWTGTSGYLIFVPRCRQLESGKWKIESMYPLANYVFYNGDDYVRTAQVFADNTFLTSIDNVTLKFNQIGSYRYKQPSYEMIYDNDYTVIDFQNTHENEYMQDGVIVNEKTNKVDYEMLYMNHFKQLEHSTQKVLNRKTMLQGSVDRLHFVNKEINDIIKEEQLTYSEPTKWYFKPTQILHITPDSNNSIKGVGVGYEVGEKIYLCTNDNKHIISAFVTDVDIALQQGFIEAVVDTYESPWFCETDYPTIQSYLNDPITCHIIPDNYASFLDEVYLYKSNNNKYSTKLNFDNVYEAPINISGTYIGEPIYKSNLLNHFDGILPFGKDMILSENAKPDIMGDVPDRFNYVYLGQAMVDFTNDITFNILDKDLCDMKESQEYPILRTEPNDHYIWDTEVKKFLSYANEINVQIKDVEKQAEGFESLIKESPYDPNIVMYKYKLDTCRHQIKSLNHKYNKFIRMANNLENPTNLDNVLSDNAAIVYMNNNRTRPYMIHTIKNVSSILSQLDGGSGNVKIFVYDLDAKAMVDASKYKCEYFTYQNKKYKEHGDYKTKLVFLHDLRITFPNNTTIKNVFVWFGYKNPIDGPTFKDLLPTNSTTCKVLFKPIISQFKDKTDYNPYTDIKVRKQYSSTENYIFKAGHKDYDPETDTQASGIFHITRPNASNYYRKNIVFRVSDVVVSDGTTTYDYESNKFDIFATVKENVDGANVLDNIFKNVHTCKYTYILNDHPVTSLPFNTKKTYNNQIIDLYGIKVSRGNIQGFEYDGTTSNVMFKVLLTYPDSNNKLTCKILESTLDTDDSITITSDTSIVCVDKDAVKNVSTNYTFIMNITVNSQPTSNAISISKHLGTDSKSYAYFVNKNNNAEYVVLPEDFYVKFKNADASKEYTVSLVDNYERTFLSLQRITTANPSPDIPKAYYVDTKNNYKLPISDVRYSNIEKRLDLGMNPPDVKIVKASYIGICRYSLKDIPKDGLIDATGYICNPLSMKRYEFWVNGRCLSDHYVRILSPTSFQLCNLRSLHNFELIELVYDKFDNFLTEKTALYADANGNVYNSYADAMKSSSNIQTQYIGYAFNALTHTALDNYTIIKNPNNIDAEDNILDNLTFGDSSNYNVYYDVPTINGVPIENNVNCIDLGMEEITKSMVQSIFDHVCSTEILTDPVFYDMYTNTFNDSYDISFTVINETYKDTTKHILIDITGNTDEYFTVTVYNIKNDGMTCVLILPFVKSGMQFVIEKSVDESDNNSKLLVTSSSKKLKCKDLILYS